jgi:2-phospho-L-lactate guanylyltransferase
MWFGARITPPAGGTFSRPVQVRFVTIFITGITSTTAVRRQNPSPRCATVASQPVVPLRNHACTQASGTRQGWFSAGRWQDYRVAEHWTVVIPVKPLDSAKSRLRGAVPAGRHADLALALVRDTVAAALACPAVREVLVVTDDPAAARAALALGARVEPDRPDAGLNAAVRFGADVIAGVARPRAALAADLPALRPDELAAALALARRRSFVADAEGSGTVLLAAPPGVPLDPRFGVGSAAAHAASDARALTGDWPGLRRDVDTPADLQTVMELGAGPCTSAVLFHHAGHGRDLRSRNAGRDAAP